MRFYAGVDAPIPTNDGKSSIDKRKHKQTIPSWVTAVSLAIVGVFTFLVTSDVIISNGPSQPKTVYWLLILGTAITGGYIGLVLTHVLSTRKVGKREGYLLYPMVIAVVVIVLLASYAVYVRLEDAEPLRESGGALTYEIQDLDNGFYRSWDNAYVWIYSGEPIVDGRTVYYPISGGWVLDSSVLTITGGPTQGDRAIVPKSAEFGATDIGESWFNLTVTDMKGDGMVGDGDRLRIYSYNGSFSEDTVYYMELTVLVLLDALGGSYSEVLGFEFSFWGFDSWVQSEPTGIAW